MIISTVSLFLGIGIASPISEGATRIFIEHLPWFSGYREPQKWIWILMLIEGIGFILGVWYLLRRYGRDVLVRWMIFVILSLLLLIWSPGPLMGYHGQLRTTVFPAGYSQVRAELMTESWSTKVLALPWHSYLGCSWTGRSTISNPIQALLSPIRVVSSDNIEVGDILYTNSQESSSKDIEIFISSHDYSHIAWYNYSHIIRMKQCASDQWYDWLDQIPECLRVFDDPYISLYQCQK